MATATGLENSSVPSESWDDDFDFQSQSGSPKRTKNAHEMPNTTRMSTATEDWDMDPITTHEPPRPSNVNIAAANLANWAEDDPSTPQKASLASAAVFSLRQHSFTTQYQRQTTRRRSH
ncbi:hypothetical protein NP233_g8766 [Leucocoprinus birnbaumii]|uniref:Uncharacterized protein n=1 Tax=Leucocoprinus birnbaumii TaxID=56174 RepID=A0AAD5YTJ0_9AGAR|nr:hypothetical protein NP233_g8766 [Leucocoprinus birnbaumii]